MVLPSGLTAAGFEEGGRRMTIQEYVERGREAVEAIKDYDQAQTDKLVYEAAKII